MRRSSRLVQLCSRQASAAAQASASVHAVDAHAQHAQLHHLLSTTRPLAAAATSSSYHDSRSHQHVSPWALPAISLGAAAALLAAQTSSSKAEAPVGKASSNDSTGEANPVQAAQEALHEAWVEVQLDQQRRVAQLPGAAADSCPMPPAGSVPRAQEVDGRLLVTIPVRPGTDGWLLSSRLQAAVNELARGSGFTSVHSSAKIVGDSMLREWNVTTQGPDGKRSSLKLQQCRGGSPDACAVVVEKEAGPLSPQEIAVLHKLVHAANEVGSSSEPMNSLMSGVQQARQIFGDNFFNSLDELFKESVLPHWPSQLHQPEGVDEFVEWLDGIYAQGKGAAEEWGRQPPFRFPPQQQEEQEQQLQRRDKLAGLQLPEQMELQTQGGPWGSTKAEQAVQQLQDLGCKVIPPGNKENVDWGVLAGYEQQKRTIEDCLLLPLQHPEVYDQIAAKTRHADGERGSSRPRAVLFEGPPGTGKTTSARVLSTQAAVPLVYVPLEALLSKWYGESENLMAKIFKAATALGGCILFIDELDALATSRDSHSMHEVTRRLLSLLLREIDGFETGEKRAVVIGATNRRQDLDPALLSRFDMIIRFDVPDEACRRAILKKFARQLGDDEIQRLAARTKGMSGRDLRDVCEQTERRWASKVIRKEAPADAAPTLEEYLASAKERTAARADEEFSLLSKHRHDFARASL